MTTASFTLLAPAKVNLCLHIVGKRADGYHLLQSAVAFVNAGDTLEFTSDTAFKLETQGPYASNLGTIEDNLAYKAAKMLEKEYGVPACGKIILAKNLPVASGIGGGSSDAATAILGLVRLLKLPLEPPRLSKMALPLGADLPVCLAQKSVWMEGIGEKISSLALPKNLHFVLVNPLIPLATPAVFKAFQGSPFSSEMTADIKNMQLWHNDLMPAAIQICPAISDVLKEIEKTKGCSAARMSGSGATCFGIYESTDDAKTAEIEISRKHPGWWVKSAALLT